MRRGPVADHPCDRAQRDDEDRDSEAEYRPVEGDSWIRVDRAHRPERRERREPYSHDSCEQRSEHHCASDADEPVGGRHGRPCANGAQHFTVLGTEAKLAAGHLAGDEQCGEGDYGSEDAEGEGLRLDRALRLVQDTCLGIGERRESLGKNTGDPGCDSGDVPSAAAHPDAAFGVVDTAVQELVGECRGEQVVGRAGRVHVVFDDRAVEKDDPGHLLVYDPLGLDTRRAETGQLRLGVGVDAHREHAAHVHTEGRSPLGAQHELVRPVGVGHPALDHCDLVLIEVHPVHAAVAVAGCRRIEVGGDERAAVSLQRQEVDSGLALHLGYMRQARDRLDHRRVVARVAPDRRIENCGRADQVRRVGAGPEHWERGRRAPGRGDRGHRQTADQAQQQDDREITGPAVPERGPKAVPGQPDLRPLDHPQSSHSDVSRRDEVVSPAGQHPHGPRWWLPPVPRSAPFSPPPSPPAGPRVTRRVVQAED